MNIVLFMGAGFSAPFGMPTMDEFITFTKNSSSLKNPETDLLSQIFQSNLQSSYIIEGRFNNLENILSYALMGERLQLEQNFDSPISDMLIEIIRKIYSEVRSEEKIYSNCAEFIKFLCYDSIRSKHNLEIITTNYDLNIEFSLQHNQLTPRLNFDFEYYNPQNSTSDQLYKNIPGSIPLYKLHGSINWFTRDDQSKIIVDGRIIKNLRIDPNALTKQKNDSRIRNVQMPAPYLDNDSFQYKNLKPIITPPSFVKSQYHRNLNTNWIGAAHAIRNADELIFVGYSFPSSDTEMKYFFTRSLAQNMNIRNIHIIDLNAEDIVARLQKSEYGYGSYFKDKLKAHKGAWINFNLLKMGTLT